MEIFDLVADVITRNNDRKGAIKTDLMVWHPDVINYIESKDNTEVLNRMNISVMVTDEFMESVVNDDMWELVFPDYENDRDLYDNEWNGSLKDWRDLGGKVKVYEEIPARELYDKIMEHAHKTGEPGISFYENMNVDNNLSHIGDIRSTNPCSEFTSVPYNSCNLGSLNLLDIYLSEYAGTREEGLDEFYSEYYRTYPYYEDSYFNDDLEQFVYSSLKPYVEKAVIFLNKMIDVNKLPLEEIQEMTEKTRPIGLGIMGLADLLALWDIPYGSPKSIEVIDYIMSHIKQFALETSVALGTEVGVYEYSENDPKRNSHLLSIAPTGSISFIAQTSGGLEPNFAYSTTRETQEGDLYYQFNDVLEGRLKYLEGISDITEIEEEISNNLGIIPDNLKNEYNLSGFVTAQEVTPKEHLDVLAKVTEYVDLSISKTINLPNNATIEDVKNIYMEAWERGVKCVTIYRDGSRENVLSGGNKAKEKEEKEVEIKSSPKEAHSKRYKLKTGCGTMYFIPTFDEDGNLIEIFNSTSNGGCKATTEAMSRVISLALRSGVPLKKVIDQLDSINPCPAYMYSKGKGEDVDLGSSCPSAIANKLRRYVDGSEDILETKVEEKKKEKEILDDKNICPECGESKLQMESGCVHCSICGWSKCG